jgi:2,5-diketo-D-gluconate reductase A
MNKKNTYTGINRREFLQTSAKLAASAMFMGLGTSKLFELIT